MRKGRKLTNIQHVNLSYVILAISQQCMNAWISFLCFSCQVTFKEVPHSFIEDRFLDYNMDQCHCHQAQRAGAICRDALSCLFPRASEVPISVPH